VIDKTRCTGRLASGRVRGVRRNTALSLSLSLALSLSLSAQYVFMRFYPDAVLFGRGIMRRDLKYGHSCASIVNCSRHNSDVLRKINTLQQETITRRNVQIRVLTSNVVITTSYCAKLCAPVFRLFASVSVYRNSRGSDRSRITPAQTSI
jgi:hypothetical protein